MRAQDRQPYLRVALLCGGLGLLFLSFAIRMLVEGERVGDLVWPFVLGGVSTLIAVIAAKRHLDLVRYLRTLDKHADRG